MNYYVGVTLFILTFVFLVMSWVSTFYLNSMIWLTMIILTLICFGIFLWGVITD